MYRRALPTAILLVLLTANNTAAQTTPEIMSVYSSGDVDSTLVLIGQALAQDSTQISLWNVKSRIHKQRQQIHEYVAALETIISLSPQQGSAHLALAEIWLDSGWVDRAAPHIEAAWKSTTGGNVRLHYQTGRLMEAQNNPDSAVAEYRRAWQLTNPIRNLRTVR